MKNCFRSTIIFLSLFSTSLNAQVVSNVDWVQNFSERDQIANIPSAIDANDNIYITGNTVSGLSFNITTIKYNSSGVQQWVQHYDNGGFEDANAITLDGNRNATIWQYNQGQSFDLNNIPSDIAMMRYSMLPMAMVDMAVEENEEVLIPITIYPNPANNSINIKYDGTANEHFSISIFDITGKLITVINEKEFSTGQIESINVANLSSGIYCINITSESTSQSFKFIKQ